MGNPVVHFHDRAVRRPGRQHDRPAQGLGQPVEKRSEGIVLDKRSGAAAEI